MSPIYNNNPGFSVLEISKIDENALPSGLQEPVRYRLVDVTFYFLDLSFFILFKSKVWHSYDIGREMGVNLDSAESIRQLYQRMMNNLQLYRKFVGITYG